MVKKTLGYVELEWECPKCGSHNPGPKKFCANCGSPQPKNVEFSQVAEEKIITDEDEIRRAKAGPDVHCAYCGARNAVGTPKCTQCGADLGEAKARESGRVLGAHRSGPAPQVECPRCGALNPANAFKCKQCNASLPRKRTQARKTGSRTRASKTTSRSRTYASKAASPSQKPAAKRTKLGLFGILGGAVVILFLCVFAVMIALSMRTEEMTGQVQAVSWMRSIEIEELRNATKEDWRDKIPPGANLGPCSQRLHHTQDDPAPNATEVCGTPYTVDTGTGHGEVIQDCKYRVYADWCKYTVQDWRQTDAVVLRGEDLNPRWPALNLGAGQREGERDEAYEVVFRTETRTYTYQTDDVIKFSQYEIGSRWLLKVNSFGGAHPVGPAR